MEHTKEQSKEFETAKDTTTPYNKKNLADKEEEKKKKKKYSGNKDNKKPEIIKVPVANLTREELITQMPTIISYK
jgi:hypothetical protein